MWWVLAFVVKWLVSLFPPPAASYDTPWKKWDKDKLAW
jgi:hypothetical protein